MINVGYEALLQDTKNIAACDPDTLSLYGIKTFQRQAAALSKMRSQGIDISSFDYDSVKPYLNPPYKDFDLLEEAATLHHPAFFEKVLEHELAYVDKGLSKVENIYFDCLSALEVAASTRCTPLVLAITKASDRLRKLTLSTCVKYRKSHPLHASSYTRANRLESKAHQVFLDKNTERFRQEEMDFVQRIIEDDIERWKPYIKIALKKNTRLPERPTGFISSALMSKPTVSGAVLPVGIIALAVRYLSSEEIFPLCTHYAAIQYASTHDDFHSHSIKQVEQFGVAKCIEAIISANDASDTHFLSCVATVSQFGDIGPYTLMEQMTCQACRAVVSERFFSSGRLQ